jgi:hypothetical protein
MEMESFEDDINEREELARSKKHEASKTFDNPYRAFACKSAALRKDQI